MKPFSVQVIHCDGVDGEPAIIDLTPITLSSYSVNYSYFN